MPPRDTKCEICGAPYASWNLAWEMNLCDYEDNPCVASLERQRRRDEGIVLREDRFCYSSLKN